MKRKLHLAPLSWTILAPIPLIPSNWSWLSKRPSISKSPTKTPRKSVPCKTPLTILTSTESPRSSQLLDRPFEGDHASVRALIVYLRRNMAAVEEKVKQIIVEQLGVDEAEVTPSASFVDDLGADSLDTVELVMAFEEAFELEIPDEDAEKIRTVQDAVDYIGKHGKGGK